MLEWWDGLRHQLNPLEGLHETTKIAIDGASKRAEFGFSGKRQGLRESVEFRGTEKEFAWSSGSSRSRLLVRRSTRNLPAASRVNLANKSCISTDSPASDRCRRISRTLSLYLSKCS